MNLATKLAGLMDVWPETTVAYAQDPNGEVYPFMNHPVFDGVMWDGDVDLSEYAGMFEAEILQNYASEIVTKEDWEAARVAK